MHSQTKFDAAAIIAMFLIVAIYGAGDFVEPAKQRIAGSDCVCACLKSE